MMPFQLRFRCLLAAAAIAARDASAFLLAAPEVAPATTFHPPSLAAKVPPSAVGFSTPGTTSVATPFYRSDSGRHRRSLHVLQSAKVIPYAFRSMSAALVIKAARTVSRSKADAAVLLGTAFLGWFNFPALDNDRLKAAKRAVKRWTRDAPEGDEVAVAKKYKEAVRVKIFGQFLTLLWMAIRANTGRNVLLGTAAVVSWTVVFLVLGGGEFQHSASGRLTPIDPGRLWFLYAFDGSIVAAAAVSAFLEPSSAWRRVLAGYVALGCFGGALDGLAPKAVAEKTMSEEKKEEEEDAPED